MRYFLLVLVALLWAPEVAAAKSDPVAEWWARAARPSARLFDAGPAWQADPQQPAAPQQAVAPQPAPAGAALTLPATVCGQTIPAPAKLPPAGSPTLPSTILLCFEKQGETPMIEANTYLYYIEAKSKVSRPSEDLWVPYTPAIEQTVLGDFKRLWATNFLDDLAIDVRDIRYSNGVMGKLVIYDIEERQKIKIVDYVGSKKVEQSKIEEELKKKELLLRLDSFIDPGTVKRVAGVVRTMYAEKGYQYAEVKPEISAMGADTKLVHLTFGVKEFARSVRRNTAMSDGKLNKQLKDKGPRIPDHPAAAPSRGKFETTPKSGVLPHGYINAGQPDLKTLEDAKDGHPVVELRIPVSEGTSKIGTVVRG